MEISRCSDRGAGNDRRVLAVWRRDCSVFGPPRVELKEAYAENPSGPSFDHSVLEPLLQQYVDSDGGGDYVGLQADVAKLDRYLESFAAAPLDAMGRDEKLALLISACNASTLKLILDHQPVNSIQDIPEKERWDAVRWNLLLAILRR